MSSDRWMTQTVERWVEQSSPAAPWLEDSVITALRRQTGERRMSGPLNASSSAVAVVAAFVLGMAVIGTLLLGAQAVNRAPTAAGVNAYRATVDAQYATLYGQAHSSDSPCYAELSGPCRARKVAARDAARAFLARIQAANPPSTMVPINAVLEAHLEGLISRLDFEIELLSANPTASSDGFDLIDLGALADVLAQIDCWPQTGRAGSVANDFASRSAPAPVCAS